MPNARRARNRYRQNQTRQAENEATATARARARYSGGAVGGGNVALPGSPGNPSLVGPPPPDPELIAAQAATARGVGLADAQATFDTGRINRDFGYDAQGGIDPSNAYSRSALLERLRQQHTQGNTNSMAARGQLYSGALQNAQNETTFGYLSDSNSLRNQYTDSLGQTSLNQAGAYANAGSALSPEILASIQRALGK